MSTCDQLDLETCGSRPFSQDPGAGPSGPENIIQGPFPMEFIPLPLNHYVEQTRFNFLKVCNCAVTTVVWIYRHSVNASKHFIMKTN